MVAPRDLAEAQSFSRRRLVTAFVAGTSGPETESPRPGRALVGGLVLAGLLLAGVAVRHELGSHGPSCAATSGASSGPGHRRPGGRGRVPTGGGQPDDVLHAARPLRHPEDDAPVGGERSVLHRDQPTALTS